MSHACAPAGTSIEALAQGLKAAFKLQHLYIKDISACGCGQKFEVYVCSESFVGVKTLDRHRMVQNALASGKWPGLHPLEIRLYLEKMSEVATVSCIPTIISHVLT